MLARLALPSASAALLLALAASHNAGGVDALPLQVKRSNPISFTITNSCEREVQPVFEPALPSGEWSKLAPGQSATVEFKSDTYVGSFYASLQDDAPSPSQAAEKNVTRGEINLVNGQYDISLANGFNVPLYLQNVGRQYAGQCTAAYCADAQCADAYRTDSGLLTSMREGDPATSPNHECPLDFTQWRVSFC